jgi:hypothetical protein
VFVLIAGVALLAAGCGGGGGTTTTVVFTTTVVHTTTARATTATSTTVEVNGCTGDSMSGAFKVVPGSAGAGQIVYRLSVTNTSPVRCYVSGLPDVQLLGSDGAELPTKVVPEQPGTATSARIVLSPGASASAEARFSPDVTGTGDQTNGACQPQATTLRVAFGGSPLDVQISPATSVCERGTLQFKLFSAA